MDIKIGKYNSIPDGTFVPWKGGTSGPVVVGDCNVIHENVRILVGPGGFHMGDWNVVHNRCFLGGPGPLSIGHNGWFGQEVWLDSTGGLTLRDGVRIGLKSAVWSHMASGEQLEGWPIVARSTVLDDGVWLVGDGVHVAAGVRMGSNSAALAHSAVTRDTLPDRVYAGVPAKLLEMKLRVHLTDDERKRLMTLWCTQFAREHTLSFGVTSSGNIIISDMHGIELVIGFERPRPQENVTFFDLSRKTYTKRLTELEREFYQFLYGNRARFIPERGEDEQ